MSKAIVPTDEENPLIPIVEETKQDTINNFSNYLTDMIYTVISDFGAELMNRGISKDDVDGAASLVFKKWSNEPIKIRKKPAPRAPKARAQEHKQQPIDAATATRRLTSKKTSTLNINWTPHPNNPELFYAKEFHLFSGCAVRNQAGKIVATATATSTNALTIEDARIAAQHGYSIDNTFMPTLLEKIKHKV